MEDGTVEKKWILLLVILCTTHIRSEDKGGNFLKKYMTENNVIGTVVIESLKSEESHIYNRERSAKRYLPASTFKILNTLIALQEKVVKDENEIVKWDGKDYGMKMWNEDQNMKKAFTRSCVWFYQKLAKDIGDDLYLEYLKNINYGNAKTGSEVHSFWLNGDLRISSIEQIEFLKGIYNREYEFAEENYDILEKIMTVEENEKYQIKAKTGVVAVAPKIAWYVGYMETKDDVWFFACNIDYTKPEHMKLRKQIVYEAFRELNIL